jgi:hypothetical protein
LTNRIDNYAPSAHQPISLDLLVFTLPTGPSGFSEQNKKCLLGPFAAPATAAAATDARALSGARGTSVPEPRTPSENILSNTIDGVGEIHIKIERR